MGAVKLGKVCPNHPEMHGRRKASGDCVGCARERDAARNRNPAPVRDKFDDSALRSVQWPPCIKDADRADA